MKLLVLVPVGRQAGLICSSEFVDVFAVHAAFPENLQMLRGRRYDAVMIQPETIIGQSTRAQLEEIKTMVRPSVDFLDIQLIGHVNVDQGT